MKSDEEKLQSSLVSGGTKRLGSLFAITRGHNSTHVNFNGINHKMKTFGAVAARKNTCGRYALFFAQSSRKHTRHQHATPRKTGPCFVVG
jgi:hypothetical protein